MKNLMGILFLAVASFCFVACGSDVKKEEKKECCHNKDKKELRYTNENKEIINKDSQYEDLSFSDLSQNEKNQLSNFNLKTNTNHRIYTDHSTKEKFIVVDGEKVIVGDKNK